MKIVIKLIAIMFVIVTLNNPLLSQISMLKFDNTACDTTLYNKYDINHRKTGIWICSSNDVFTISLYADGEKDGSELIYTKQNNEYYLWYIENYCKGNLKNWLWFIDAEKYYIIDSINVNNSLIKDQKIWIDLDTLYESYIRYYEKGRLKEEGWTIYPEDFELDSEDVGMWKIYDDKGNVYFEERGKKVLPNFRR